MQYTQVTNRLTLVEYIKFKHSLSVSELLIIAKSILGANYKDNVKTSDNKLKTILGVSDGRYAVNQTLCFLERKPSQKNIHLLKESFIITNKEVAPELDAYWIMIVDDPRAMFIDLLNKLQICNGFSSFTSIVDETPSIHPKAQIHPQAIVESGVFIDSGTTIASGCVIKKGSYIGRNVTIRENTVIGCDGIALYKSSDGRVLRFPHLAGVIIEDEVEIGVSCVLPRGVMTSSHIGQNTVIGNLSNLGHSVKIGKKVWMSVGCLIGGNTIIDEYSTLGLGVRVRDNLHIGIACSIGMGSVIVKDVLDNSSMFGNPAKKLRSISAGPKR